MWNLEHLQSFAVPLVIALFLGFRWMKFKKMKSKIPELLKKGGQLVDVRSSHEFAAGSNPLAVNIPLDRINVDYQKLDPKKPVILCCASGVRSGTAAAILRSKGFSEVINAGPWSNTLKSNSAL